VSVRNPVITHERKREKSRGDPRAAVILWATDFVHRVHPGWIGRAAGLATLLPYIGVMPVTSFTERVKLSLFFYIAAILGLGAVMVETSLSRALSDALQSGLQLQLGQDAINLAILTALSTNCRA
jgi:hypothetical protein